MEQAMLYMVAGAILFAIGLTGVFMRRDMVIRVVAANIMASGTFIVIVAGVPRDAAGHADPVAQALVLTGVVISVSLSGYALALVRRLHETMNARHRKPSESEARATPPAGRGQ